MYSGIPILCLDDKGLAAETIRKTRTGFTLNPKNINALKDTILECYHKWQKNIPILATSINQDEVKRYDRRVTSQQLAALFKTVLEK